MLVAYFEASFENVHSTGYRPGDFVLTADLLVEAGAPRDEFVMMKTARLGELWMS